MAERTDETVERTVAIPFELAEIAAEVAELAAAVADEGNPNVSGDAAAGADLAAAVASIAARLVEINARAGDDRSCGPQPRRRRGEGRRPSGRCGHVLGTVPGTCPETQEIPAAARSKALRHRDLGAATTPRRRRR